MYYEKEQKEIDDNRKEIEATTLELGIHQNTKVTIENELKEYGNLDVETPSKELLDKLQEAITLMSDENEKFYEDKTKWETASNNAIKAGNTVDKVKSILQNLELQLKENEEQLENISDLPLQELEARQSLRDHASGRLDQAARVYQEAEVRHSSFKEQQEKDKRVLQITKDIDILSDVFARKGLPREFVNLKFTKLMERTQENLSTLHSDFTIICDEENPLSFKFQRYDGKEHVELPMAKLSGGQRVRLCTAFLLACQKELVSDVGLMTFDEPSTHLDSEGVDSLQSLFAKLQDLFKESEYQIWISDHHPDLEKSFNKTLKLS